MDIVALTEKKKGSGVETPVNYNVYLYSGVLKEERTKRVILLLPHEKLKQKIINWEAINENILRLNVNILQQRVKIFGEYAISDDAPVVETDIFFAKLNPEINIVGKEREIIIFGDLNSRIGVDEDSKVEWTVW